MIIHADMPRFGEYRVVLNRVEITPQVYMADSRHGIVITRHWASAFGGFVYHRVTGTVQIIHSKTAKVQRRKSVFGKQSLTFCSTSR